MEPLIDSPALRWFGDELTLLDQRRLPAETCWLTVRDATTAAAAIRDMAVRGAPAIGIAAAYGLALEAIHGSADTDMEGLAPALQRLRRSRPTAVNLFHALQRMEAAGQGLSGEVLARALRREAEALHREDQDMNRRLAERGVELLPEGVRVYTHCNTGALATGGHGTALGLIRSAWQAGRITGVVAGETRPWLQGARLTTWELMREHIPVTLVVDGAAAHMMATGEVGAVVVGADRIAANGDTANKIGTLGLAILARHYQLPFIVAAPSTTVDPDCPDGHHIRIEERPGREVRAFAGMQVAPEKVRVANPAFDITPAALITAIVTEEGVMQTSAPPPGPLPEGEGERS